MPNSFAIYGNSIYNFIKTQSGISIIIVVSIICIILSIYTMSSDTESYLEQKSVESFGTIEGNTSMKQSELENILKTSEKHAINNESTHLVNALENNHRDIIEQLHTATSHAIIAEISSNAQTISKDHTSDIAMQYMDRIIKMNEFNSVLKESVDFYDTN